MENLKHNSRQLPGISRREFISQAGLLATLGSMFPARILAEMRNSDSALLPSWIQDEPWQTISNVQEHLFPATDDAPGASDFHAVVYLRNTIETEHADNEDRDFIVKGAAWLNDLAKTELGDVFNKLDEKNREIILRKIEGSRDGRRWLSLLLTYLIEALLADPVYGGNPKGVGWKWLQHQPGFPQPPSDKSWYKLAAPVRFQRKAGEA